MSNLGGMKALPLSYKTIEAIAQMVRQKYGIGSGEFPARELERIIFKLFGGDKCSFGVRDDIEQEGLTLVNGTCIILRSDVYDNLFIHNEPRARFTAMHELSHRILHCHSSSSMARGRGEIKTYCDPEWQADALAGAILCPAHEIKQKNINEIMEEYGVSQRAAAVRLKVVNKYF